MSRTYKDKPWKLKYPQHLSNYDRVQLDGYWYAWLQIPGKKTKKKKNVDTEWHWQGTPSWWTRMFMIRPRRNAENRQLRNIVDTDEFDFIDVKRKNHKYYW